MEKLPFNHINTLHMLYESNMIEEEFAPRQLEDAYISWKFFADFEQLSNGVFKDVHKLLMANTPPYVLPKGDFRDQPVYIGGVRKALPKIVLESLMEDLCNSINTLFLSAKHGTYEDAINFHLQFESIHPFIDGNGRMGRMLMNWICLKWGLDMIVYNAKTKYEDYYTLFR